MNEDLKNNIFYRPQVEIDRNYKTDGVIDKITPEESPEESKSTSNQDLLTKAEKVTDALIRVRKVLPILPEGLPNILQDIIDNLIFQTEIEKDKLIEIIDEENPIETTTPEGESEPIDKPEPIIDDDGFIWDDPEPLDYTITVVKTKLNDQMALEQYLKDSIYIKEDFIKNLNDVLQDYIYPLISMMDESGVGSIQYLNLSYDGTSVSGYDDNDQHLNDTIVRNQLINEEQIRLFNKTHDANTTLSVLMAFDLAAQQRIRYYSEQYDLGVSNFTEMYRRMTLEKARKAYEYRYANARKNVYKYLNSAVRISDDLLKLALDEKASKCYLLTQDINIFARKEYEAVAYENSTGNNAAEVDPGNNSNKATDTTKKKTKEKETESESNSNTIENFINGIKI